jgi:hypothetical protein
MVKEDVTSFMSTREKDDSYYQFINWRRKENEIVVLTEYANADVPLPINLDTIFQFDQPGNSIQLDFSITQAVFNGWMPINEISRGHKHFCIIEFSTAVPDLFQSLPLFDKSFETGIRLGLCLAANFESIKTKLLAREIDHDKTE